VEPVISNPRLATAELRASSQRAWTAKEARCSIPGGGQNPRPNDSEVSGDGFMAPEAPPFSEERRSSVDSFWALVGSLAFALVVVAIVVRVWDSRHTG
jgi:hypothetical protein